MGDAGVCSRAGGSRTRLAPVVSVLLAAVVVGLARWGPDWPAQEFRAWSAAHDGLTAWTNLWYGGQALPGYSVVYPLIAGVIGAGWTGLVAVVAAVIGASGLAPASNRTVRLGYDLSVGFVLCCNLVIGQVPFLLGVAFAAWALRCARSSPPMLTAVLAVAAAVSSPLAGAFVVVALPALGQALGWRRALPLGAAGIGVAVSGVLGGAGGPFPFEALGFVCVLAFASLTFMVTPRSERAARTLAACYLAASVVAFVVPNPVGGNLARFGQLVALPVVWHVAPRLRVGRMWLAAPLAALAALWPAWPAVSSIGRGAADPSKLPAYYAGLLHFLDRQDPTAGRLEVVFTREHWETLWVARAFPIARGWERQTDLANNAVLYQPLTARRYRAWLDRNAVSLVALPTAPIDYGGRAEAALLRHPPSYLIPVWRDANWKVWQVRNAVPLLSGPARMVRLGPASFTVAFAHAGSAVVRIRASGMWTVTAGEGCVGSTNDAWLRLTATAPSTLTIRARVGLSQLNASPHCA